jgi:tRNA A37 methylthiotransferase MiaB
MARERARRLGQLARDHRAKTLRTAVGSEQTVLVERIEGRWARGYTRGYMRAKVRMAGATAAGTELRARVIASTADELEAVALDE